jgi:DNA-binding transcriptional regulator LsrR (DeoR family)
MYYEQDMSQEEIARTLGKSRPTISRMLAAAREQGIVHIDIRVPLDRAENLERALTERFGLSDCRVVVAPRGEAGSVDHLGRVAADYLQLILQDGMTLGVSNGRTLASTAKYLAPKRALHLDVVQIIGALGNEDSAIDGPDIARALAAAYEARCRYLHVPLLVDDARMRNMLLRDRRVSEVLQAGAAADVVLVGVGTQDSRDRSPLFKGFLTEDEIAAIRQAGGVGHICGEHYSAAGDRLSIDVNDRTVGIGLAALANVPRVIAVAGGAVKAPAIAAGVAGGYLDTLITDDRAAARMLQMPPPHRTKARAARSSDRSGGRAAAQRSS